MHCSPRPVCLWGIYILFVADSCGKVRTNIFNFLSVVRLLINKHTEDTRPNQPHGSTQTIFGVLCWNGVSSSFEILSVKAPLRLNLLRASCLDVVPISSDSDLCVCVCVRAFNKCRHVFCKKMQRYWFPCGAGCRLCSNALSCNFSFLIYFPLQHNKMYFDTILCQIENDSNYAVGFIR